MNSAYRLPRAFGATLAFTTMALIASLVPSWLLVNAAAVAAPRVALDRSAAQGGERVTLRGWDFPAGTDGQLTWDGDGAVIGTFTVDDDGAFAAAFPAPDSQVGAHRVAAVAGGTTAQATIDLVAHRAPPRHANIDAMRRVDVPPSDPQVLGWQAAPSSALTFTPTADAWVGLSEPAANHGTASELLVDGEPVMSSFLRFDVSGATGPITTAKLRVYVFERSVVQPSVYSVGNSWT